MLILKSERTLSNIYDGIFRVNSKRLKADIVLNGRPLNSHVFTVCHTVSLPFSRSRGRFFISHGFKFWADFFPNSQFSKKKQTQAAHSNALEEHILVWLTKIKQAVAVLCLVGHYCSLWRPSGAGGAEGASGPPLPPMFSDNVPFFSKSLLNVPFLKIFNLK